MMNQVFRSILSTVLLVMPIAAHAADAFLVDNGNGTISDLTTGLMWQQSDSQNYTSGGLTVIPQARTWSSATSYCDTLKLAGKSDWRLPNVKELSSLVDDRKPFDGTNPVVDIRNFPQALAGYYWSNSSYATDSAYAWHVDFNKGSSAPLVKVDSDYVRCVRGG